MPQEAGDYAFIYDANKKVVGMWWRDPAKATPEMVATALDFKSAAERWTVTPAKLALTLASLRTVPNHFDSSGGVFVMFGNNPAPGEKPAAPAVRPPVAGQAALNPRLEAAVQKYKAAGYSQVSSTGTSVILKRRAPANTVILVALIFLLWPGAIIYWLTLKKYQVTVGLQPDGRVIEFGGTLGEFERDRAADARKPKGVYVLLILGSLVAGGGAIFGLLLLLGTLTDPELSKDMGTAIVGLLTCPTPIVVLGLLMLGGGILLLRRAGKAPAAAPAQPRAAAPVAPVESKPVHAAAPASQVAVPASPGNGTNLTIWVRDEATANRMAIDPNFLFDVLSEDGSDAARKFMQTLDGGASYTVKTHPDAARGGFNIELTAVEKEGPDEEDHPDEEDLDEGEDLDEQDNFEQDEPMLQRPAEGKPVPPPTQKKLLATFDSAYLARFAPLDTQNARLKPGIPTDHMHVLIAFAYQGPHQNNKELLSRAIQVAIADYERGEFRIEKQGSKFNLYEA